jgi:hypothetical protein
MANLRVRLLAAATVNGKRSYYKPAMRSTGWPDGGAVLVKGRKVRIDASQLHAYYVTWPEGQKQQFENVGKDALSAWQAKLNREAVLNGVAGAAEQVAKSQGKRVTVADAIEEFLADVKAGKSVKTHLARKRMLALFQESCSKQFLDQITEADCQQFIRFLRKRYDSAKGARTVYNVFQGLNTFFRANKIFIAGSLLGKLDYDEKIVDAYTRDELKALKKACTDAEWLVWEYFWWSGCREGLGQCVTVIQIKARLGPSDNGVIRLVIEMVGQFLAEEPMNGAKFQPFTARYCDDTDRNVRLERWIITDIIFVSRTDNLGFSPQHSILFEMTEHYFSVVLFGHNHSEPVSLPYGGGPLLI